jgi:hypothetical protein
MNGFIPYFQNMKSRLGKYSILGNHDYGNYSEWPSVESKQDNLAKIMAREQEMGFRLLRNEHIRIEINNSGIFLAGVEHWGMPPFPKFGDLDKTMDGIPEGAFVILLSHSPDHWSHEVIGKRKIPLTLSGHTHGFQDQSCPTDVQALGRALPGE